MELMPGYKQTEIGVIPEGWGVVLLSDISRKITDGDHVTPRRTDAGYFLLSARNILNGRIDVSDVDYVGEDEYQRMRQRCNPELGDVLISCSGTIGRVTVVPGDFECVLVRSAALVKNNKQTSDGTFLQYWLQGGHAQKQIANSVNQGAQPNLFLNHIERIVCPHPNLSEQTAIATALSDVDAFLVAQDALIAKQRAIKQGAMQELLTGKRRLPGFEGDWVLQRLGDAATLKARIGWQGLTTAEYLDTGDYCLVTGTDFADGKIDWVNCHYVTQSRYDQDSYIQVRPRDVLVTKDGTIGKVALVEALDKPATLNSGVFVIRPKNNSFVPEFFYFLLLSRIFDEFLAQLSAGSTINHLYQKDFVGFTYHLPPTLKEQIAIAQVLSDMDAKITALETRREKTAQLKKGMMQELLTGKTRLV